MEKLFVVLQCVSAVTVEAVKIYRDSVYKTCDSNIRVIYDYYRTFLTFLSLADDQVGRDKQEHGPACPVQSDQRYLEGAGHV